MIEYAALNKEVFLKIPATAKTILDVGCGTGTMGDALKKQHVDRIVYGITYSNDEAAIAKNSLDKVLVADINLPFPSIDIGFDCIIFSHILEHTYNPETVLRNFLPFLNSNGAIIIALPNILQYKQRLEFIKGNFKYSDHGGLMDATHFRFFDWQSAQDMIKKAGLEVTCKNCSGNFPLFFIRKIFPSLSKSLDKLALKHWPGLFAYQFVFVATKKIS